MAVHMCTGQHALSCFAIPPVLGEKDAHANSQVLLFRNGGGQGGQ